MLLLYVDIGRRSTLPLNMLWLNYCRLIIGLLLRVCYPWLIWIKSLLLNLRRLLSSFMTPDAILSIELCIYTFGSISARLIWDNFGLFSHHLNLLNLLLSLSALRPMIIWIVILGRHIHLLLSLLSCNWLSNDFGADSWFIHWFHPLQASIALRIWLILVDFLIHSLHQSIIGINSAAVLVLNQRLALLYNSTSVWVLSLWWLILKAPLI